MAHEVTRLKDLDNQVKDLENQFKNLQTEFIKTQEETHKKIDKNHQEVINLLKLLINQQDGFRPESSYSSENETDVIYTFKDAPSIQNQQEQENNFIEVQELEENHIEDLRILDKNLVSWSAMIASCVQNEWRSARSELFKDMQKTDFEVSQSNYASLLRSCAGLVPLKLGTQLHGYTLKSNFTPDIVVGTSILDMYAKCGCVTNSRKLFDSLPKHSLQSYDATNVGYACSDRSPKAFYLFWLLQMSGLGFDEISLSGVFSACASIKRDIEGRQIHGLVAKTKFSSNICVINAILVMNGQCGAMTEAFGIFEEMKKRDAVYWNASYEQNGKEEETLSCFASMFGSCMEPDEFTYGSTLKAWAGLQTLGSGMEIHTRAIKSELGLEPFFGSVLVDMHCKCGKMKEVCKIHDRTKDKTIVSCNALIFYLATISLGKQIHAQIIKREMKSVVYISSTLVDMYSKCGNLQVSGLVFEKAPKRDFVTLDSMICGYSQHGHAKEVIKLLEDMQINDMKPNHETFRSKFVLT